MDAQVLEPILGAPPVTKTWFSLVLVTSLLDHFKIIDVQKHIYFFKPEEMFTRPLDALLSFCYAGKLSIYSAVNLYNTLMILRNLDTLHMRSVREYITKMSYLLLYVMFIYFVSKTLFEQLLKRFDFGFAKVILNSTRNMLVVLSLWEIMTSNLMYYGCRFQGVANFNGWFNIHPVYLFLLNLTPMFFSSMWPLTVIMFLPGHLFFYIDQVLTRLNKGLPSYTTISQKDVANILVLALTIALWLSQYAK